jgi:hypothetical protein
MRGPTTCQARAPASKIAWGHFPRRHNPLLRKPPQSIVRVNATPGSKRRQSSGGLINTQPGRCLVLTPTPAHTMSQDTARHVRASRGRHASAPHTPLGYKRRRATIEKGVDLCDNRGCGENLLAIVLLGLERSCQASMFTIVIQHEHHH